MVILLKRNIKNVAGNKLVQMEYRQNTCILSNLTFDFQRLTQTLVLKLKKNYEKKSVFEKLSAY